MTTPSPLEGQYIDVMIEDPASAGSYIPLCGMTARTFTEQVNTRDRFVRDCTAKTTPPVRHLIVTGKQWDMTANGLYNRAQAILIRDAVGQTRNYRFVMAEPADDEVYSSYLEGPAMLTQRQLGGGDTDDATAQFTFASNGTWTEVEV